MKIIRVLAALVVAFGVSGTLAQGYPSKPVRIVIASVAGGSTDIAGRVVAQRLSENMGQQFIVENRSGAAGTIAAESVAKAPPDGYTILVQSTTYVASSLLYKKLSYDTSKDFAPVALLTTQPGMLVVHPSLPVKSVRQFIALSKSRPGQILYASAGSGSAHHMSMTWFIHMTGIEIVHVPYKGGAPAAVALVAGETQATISPIAAVMGQLRAGRLRPLAVSSAQRLKFMPEMPTIAESGVPGYEMDTWIGAFAPAGTPRPIIDRLNAGFKKVLEVREVAQALSVHALEPWIVTPDEFSRRLKQDHEKYSKLIKMAGIAIE